MRSLLYAYNASVGAVTAGTAIPFSAGNIVRRMGGGCNISANTVTLNGAGYYVVSALVNGIASATADYTATLYQDGVAVAGAVSPVATAAAIGDTVSTAVPLCVVRVPCGQATSNLTVELDGNVSGGTAVITVEKA